MQQREKGKKQEDFHKPLSLLLTAYDADSV